MQGRRIGLLLLVAFVAAVPVAIDLLLFEFFDVPRLHLLLVIIAAVALSAMIMEALQGKLSRGREDSAKARRAKEVERRFSRFLRGLTSTEIPTRRLSSEEAVKAAEPLEKSIPELMLRGSGLDTDRIDALVVLWLANEWRISKGELGHESVKLFEVLGQTFESGFGSLRYEKKNRLLMLAYRKLTPDWLPASNESLESLFEGDLDPDEYEESMLDFLRKFAPQRVYDTVRATQAEKLRAVLVRLIADGALSSYGLHEDVVDRIQTELRRHGAGTNVFLVLKNLMRNLEPRIEKFPHLRGGRTRPRGFGFAEDAILYLSLVKAPDTYRDADHFIDSELRPGIRDREGFAAIVPLNVVGARIFPSQKDFEGEGFVASNYELVNFLLTGVKEPDTDIWAILAKYEIPVEEVLAALPLNALVVDLPPEASRELWDRSHEIKEHFGVRDLRDWSRVGKEELTDYLCDELAAFRELPRSEVAQKSEEIVNEARKIRVSLTPTQMDLFRDDRSQGGEHDETALQDGAE